MRRDAVLLLTLLWGLPVVAQDIRVRTADHTDFTRVVVDFTNDAQRQITRKKDQIILRSDGNEQFDLSDVYRRISRDRIARIMGPAPGDLVLDLGCDCGFESFTLANGGLVIDVAPATTPSGSPPVTRELPVGAEGLKLPDPPDFLPGLLADRIAQPQSPLRSAAASEMRAALSEQFARGAAQGLVRAARPLRTSAETGSEPTTLPLPDPVPDPFANVRVQTQIDRDRLGGKSSLSARMACLPPDLSDISLWGKPTDWPRLPEKLVHDLYDESGAPDPDAHAAKARSLLYIGFGAEAQGLLRRSGLERRETRLLGEMAQVLDGGEPGALLAGQLDCDSFAGLLAILSDDATAIEDADSALRRLADLPRHLRALLGPRLAERFVDLGLREAASTARNTYLRGAPPAKAPDAFVAIKLDADQPTDGLRERLLPVLETRAPRAAEAMRFLITSMVARGEPVGAELLGQARALSFETSDPDRAALETAILDALVADGSFSDAVSQIEAYRRSGRGPFPTVERAMFRRIAGLETDSDFLRAMVPLADRPIAEDAIRLAIARRLAGLSLGNAAERVIDASVRVPNRDERILRASIAAADGKIAIAESYLAGLEGEDVDRVRAGFRQATPQQESAPAVPLPTDSPPLRRAEIADGALTLAKSATLRDEIDALLAAD